MRIKSFYSTQNHWIVFALFSRTSGIQTCGAPCWQLHPHPGKQSLWPPERNGLQETPLPPPGGAGQEAEGNRECQSSHIVKSKWPLLTQNQVFTVKQQEEDSTRGGVLGWVRGPTDFSPQIIQIQPWDIFRITAAEDPTSPPPQDLGTTAASFGPLPLCFPWNVHYSLLVLFLLTK